MTRQLTGITGGNAYYTPITCRAQAKLGGWQYFALQFGGECWVTNSSTSWSSQGKSAKCVQECNADTRFYCGNGKVNQIYSTFDLTAPTTGIQLHSLFIASHELQ
jgi:hypothetical protein